MKTIMLLVLIQVLILAQTVRASDPTDVHPRPIPMGTSISTTPTLPFLTAGTAGMRVRSLSASNLTFILSNNHVLGAVGPTLCPNTAPLVTGVIQPGTLDLGFDPGNDPMYVVGVTGFNASRVPIEFSLFANNRVDAAIALTTPELASTEILDIGGDGVNLPPNPQLGFAQPGMPVIKSGRTTGVTTGTVEAVNVTAFVNYGAGCGTARFVGQVSVTPGAFSEPGDSGSVILEQDTRTPVALLFAGGPTVTLANPILRVYLDLGIFVDQ